jgi:hypothetical protein
LVLSIVHQLSISVKTAELTETLTTVENLAENAENPAETSNILRIPREKNGKH